MYFLRSKLNSLEENIRSATDDLENETRELKAADRLVKDAIDESTRHINAFKMFSTVHLEKIVKDVRRVQELLTEFQSKACAKAIIKKTVSMLYDGISPISLNRIHITAVWMDRTQFASEIDY